MIKIAVVDDEKTALAELSQEIQRYFERKSDACTVQTFSSGAELLERRESFDCIFLDIRMEGLSGLETAGQLRRHGADALIVFTTALQEYVYDAFEVDASDYLIKPINAARLSRTMDRLCRNMRRLDTGRLLIPTKGNACHLLLFREIYYVEAVNHKMAFHTKDAVWEGGFKITEMAGLLDDRFFQCHRSYFVNLDVVCGYENGLARLRNQEQIPVSRLRGRAFSQAVLCYMKEKRDA